MTEQAAGKHGGNSAARWAVVVLLTVIATCLLIEVGASRSGAQVAAGAGGNETFVVAGQLTKDSYGLYLVDPSTKTICVYQYLPSARKLRLRACRNFAFDLQLDEYNTEPLPREIQKLVEQHRRLTDKKPKPK